jgi:putative hydrolase of the HAD superfamily
VVAFDFGGVISHLPPDRDLVALARVAGTTVAQLRDAYWLHRIPHDADQTDATAFWDGVGTRLGTRFRDAVIAELVRLDIASWLHLQPGTLRLIEDLAASGQRLGLLSNAPTEVAGAVAGLPIAGCFEHLVFSCDLKAVKPEEAFFAAALDRFGVRAGEVLFIDDSADNVAAASRLGIRGITFTGADAARAWLAKVLPR